MIPLSSKMNQDQKFRQRWQFRRRDDDLDFSSDDSKLCSGGETVLKKHKLVSNLIFPEDVGTSDTPLSKEESQLYSDTCVPSEFEKADKIHIGPSNKNYAVKNKMKRGSMKKSNRKRNSRSMHQPISLDDFKIFMKSILEELKVTRENMFTRMREEMKKLVAGELASRPTSKEGSYKQKTGQGQYQNNIELGMKTRNCNDGSSERSLKSDRTTDSNNCYEVLEEQVNHDQTIGWVTSNEKEKVERSRLSVKKLIYSSNLCDQVVSSPYLTPPTIVSEPQVENHRIDSSCNYIQPGAAENKTGVNLERAKLLINACTSRGNFSSIQQAKQFESSSQMGSQNMGYLDQHSTQTSTMGTGFPVPLYQGLGNSFNIPTQVLETSSRDNNICGPIRFSGESHALPEHFVASNYRSRMNYKTDGVDF